MTLTFIISTVASALILFLCFVFILPPSLPCVRLRACACEVCGSHSVSESWNGNHRLDQGKEH